MLSALILAEPVAELVKERAKEITRSGVCENYSVYHSNSRAYLHRNTVVRRIPNGYCRSKSDDSLLSCNRLLRPTMRLPQPSSQWPLGLLLPN